MYQYKDNQIEINNTKFKFNLILEITPVQNKKALLNTLWEKESGTVQKKSQQ